MSCCTIEWDLGLKAATPTSRVKMSNSPVLCCCFVLLLDHSKIADMTTPMQRERRQMDMQNSNIQRTKAACETL